MGIFNIRHAHLQKSIKRIERPERENKYEKKIDDGIALKAAMAGRLSGVQRLSLDSDRLKSEQPGDQNG